MDRTALLEFREKKINLPYILGLYFKLILNNLQIYLKRSFTTYVKSLHCPHKHIDDKGDKNDRKKYLRFILPFLQISYDLFFNRDKKIFENFV